MDNIQIDDMELNIDDVSPTLPSENEDIMTDDEVESFDSDDISSEESGEIDEQLDVLQNELSENFTYTLENLETGTVTTNEYLAKIDLNQQYILSMLILFMVIVLLHYIYKFFKIFF